MRKITAIITALGFLGSTMLTPVVAATANGITKTTDEFSSEGKTAKKKTKKKKSKKKKGKKKAAPKKTYSDHRSVGGEKKKKKTDDAMEKKSEFGSATDLTAKKKAKKKKAKKKKGKEGRAEEGRRADERPVGGEEEEKEEGRREEGSIILIASRQFRDFRGASRCRSERPTLVGCFVLGMIDIRPACARRSKAQA